MDKLKVLHIVMYMGAGGLEHVTLDLCKYVDSERFDVFILCTEGCDPKYREKISDYEIPLYVIEKTKKIDLIFYKKVTSLINKLNIDIVHIHSCVFDCALGVLFSKVKGKIFTAHGLPVSSDFISKCQDHIGFRLVDKIVAVSDEVAENLWLKFKIPKMKVATIYNGVEIPKITPLSKNKNYKLLRQNLSIAKDSLVVGAVGRLVPIKNHIMLLHSFSLLLKKTELKVHLLIVGDGSEREHLEAIACDLGISRFVSFLGVRDDISVLLDAIDIFTLTSLTEGVSISLLEAQAKGIPAVVTDVGGNSCVIENGVNGFLIKLDDCELFARKIQILLENKSLYKSFSDHSLKKTTNQFDIEVVADRYEKLYRDLL